MAVKSSEAEGKDNSNSNSNGRGYSSSSAQPSMPSIFASTSFTHTSNGTPSSRPMIPHSNPKTITTKLQIHADNAIHAPRQKVERVWTERGRRTNKLTAG